MNFRTELKAPDFPFKINHQHQILSIGSCFADLMGQRLLDNKFDVLSNPFGVIFNPISIFKLLSLSLQGQMIHPENFLTHLEMWYHYDLHSTFCGQDQAALQKTIVSQINSVSDYIQKTDYLILTFGTAWVYVLKSQRDIVANCHKQPASLFEKRLLSIQEIKETFKKVYDLISVQNPRLKFIITVSPVRHIKDTLTLNSVSKSVLRIAAYELTKQFSEQVFYFPSYEFLLDDLRDYRFYEADMIHPNQVAEDYIWQKFGESFFDTETLTLLRKWTKLRQALTHRAFQPQSQSHQEFLKNTLQSLEALNTKLELSKEIQEIKSRIT